MFILYGFKLSAFLFYSQNYQLETYYEKDECTTDNINNSCILNIADTVVLGEVIENLPRWLEFANKKKKWFTHTFTSLITNFNARLKLPIRRRIILFIRLWSRMILWYDLIWGRYIKYTTLEYYTYYMSTEKQLDRKDLLY